MWGAREPGGVPAPRASREPAANPRGARVRPRPGTRAHATAVPHAPQPPFQLTRCATTPVHGSWPVRFRGCPALPAIREEIRAKLRPVSAEKPDASAGGPLAINV